MVFTTKKSVGIRYNFINYRLQSYVGSLKHTKNRVILFHVVKSIEIIFDLLTWAELLFLIQQFIMEKVTADLKSQTNYTHGLNNIVYKLSLNIIELV